MKPENKILNSIILISKVTCQSNTIVLSKSNFTKHTIPVCKKLNCSAEEAVLFAIIFKLFFDGSRAVELSDIASHLGCDTIELLACDRVLKSLVKKKLISINFNHYGEMFKEGEFSYRIKRTILDSILSPNSLPIEMEEVKDNISLLRNLAQIVETYIDKEINLNEVEIELMDVLMSNRNIFFAEKLMQLNLDFNEKLFLLYTIIKYYKGESNIQVNVALSDIFAGDRIIYDNLKLTIIKEISNLFRKNILKREPADWYNDLVVNLTKEGAEFLFNEDAQLILVNDSKTVKEFELKWDEIKTKKLFYNQEDLRSIDFISDLINEEKYKSISTRMQEKNMSLGLTILLHGKPGTGKTETVYQIAKSTQRNIYKVEISALKSMWFGESQKKIKQLFRDYYNYAATQPVMPILLFNEADGVINKRKDSSSSNVAQTENEIQNIILQEMEDFKGILMATTNLIDNIDTAFDRRFLMKIELSVPDAATRHKIIKSNIEHLNEEESWLLAKEFEFTGGVLQNIIRKSEMHHVLYNEVPKLDWYLQNCKQEYLHQHNSRNKVGFK